MTAKLQPRLVESGPDRAALGLAHRVLIPDGPGPHPTVVMLHGLSGDDRVMWIFAPRLPKDWLVVAPRAPHAEARGGFAWLPRKANEWPPIERFEPAIETLAQLVDALPGSYDADPDRIWLMGFSQGAALGFSATMRHPDKLRGVAGLVGFVPSSCESLADARPLEGKPCLMSVGLRDAMVPYAQSTAAAALLRRAGADLDYREYEAGHKLNAVGMRDLGGWWADRALE